MRRKELDFWIWIDLHEAGAACFRIKTIDGVGYVIDDLDKVFRGLLFEEVLSRLQKKFEFPLLPVKLESYLRKTRSIKKKTVRKKLKSEIVRPKREAAA